MVLADRTSPKKNGDNRVCINYTALNKFLKTNSGSGGLGDITAMHGRIQGE